MSLRDDLLTADTEAEKATAIDTALLEVRAIAVSGENQSAILTESGASAKISAMDTVASAATDDLLPGVRAGDPIQLTAQQIADLGGGGGLSGFAYDPATSDLPNGIWGYTGGRVQSDDLTALKDAGTVDLSGESDGEYHVYISSNLADVLFALNTHPAGVTVEIAEIEVESGVITIATDTRSWASTSPTLATLATALAGTQVVATPIPTWCKVATLTFADFAAGTLSGGDLVSTISAAYTTADRSLFSAVLINVSEAFDAPTIASAALDASDFNAALTAVDLTFSADSADVTPEPLKVGALEVVATAVGDTWPDFTAGSLDIWVLLSKVPV